MTIKYLLVAVLLTTATAGLWAQKPAAGRPAPLKALARITVGRARQHLELIASDRMLGRNTPSPELDSTAEYIAAKFKSYGLEPVNGSYFHQYNLKRMSLGSPNELEINMKSMKIRDDYIPYDYSASDSVTAPVVFAGFGLTMPERGYDDYDGIDVRGKIVLIISGLPKVLNKEGKDAKRIIVSSRAKMHNAARHGAVAIMIVASPVQFKTLRPFGYPWPSLYPNLPARSLPVMLDLPAKDTAIPAVSVGGETVKALWGDDLTRFTDRVRLIDSTGKPASMIFDHSSATLQVRIVKTPVPARNVVGFLPGRSKPDEVIVIGAHYDHIGHGVPSGGRNGSNETQIPSDTIFNGADDNGSGTTGLLMNAEAFGSLSPKDRPGRSILFISFSGEEKGLFGSQAYVANPSIPNEKTVAMINMDMIGRNAHDSVALIGYTRSPDLYALAKTANEAEPMLFGTGEEFFFRSDQASFARKHIPILFFSTGEHPDYHKVSDSFDKIDFDKLARISRLCFRTVWLTSETPGKPAYVDVDSNDPNAIVFEK